MANKSADEGMWRSKYSQALRTQEELEEKAAEQYRMMRRALVQLSVVADGQDEELDPLLDQLRAKLRKEEGVPAIQSLLLELDDRVHDAERRREEFDEQVLESLTKLVKGLRSLGLNPSSKRTVRQFLARLPTRARAISRYPLLLGQLADLQEQALSDLRDNRPGFWRRLRAGKKGRQDESSAGLRADLSQGLRGLLATVEPDYVSRERLQSLTDRLTPELSLNDLPSLLEEVRELVSQASLGINGVFADYLDKVNEELADIAGSFGGVVEGEAHRVQAHSKVQTLLEENCQSLESQVANAQNLEQLKQQVSTQLGHIRAAVEDYRSAESASDELTAQLNSLAERVNAMESEAQSNRTKLQEQRHKALHDPLTHLPNREAYEERVRREFQRFERSGHAATLAVCDIDCFKSINDRFGHQAGDRVLKVISHSIKKRLRRVDFFGRYGGEEFVILLPETQADEAFERLDAIRASIADTSFHYHKEPLAITLCLGLAELRSNDTPESLFARADQALYDAKSRDRNQTRVAK